MFKTPVLLAALGFAAPTLAGLHFTTEYGIEFSTIGDPGNRGTLPHEGNPLFADVHEPRGAVDYEYRIARNEVTVGQQFEFVQAYAPIYFEQTGNTVAPTALTGLGITASFAGISIRGNVSPNVATTMSWEFAARYVNWLHNDRVNEEWAFESGVYDTSTFTQNEDGSWNHQATHSADARFWIPTYDEWIKAAYWDPNKDDDEGGYWLFPNSSDTESMPGLLPEDGGGRNAGDPDDGFPLDVGSFADVQSPWGLFDLAGGEREWTGDIAEENPRRRFTLGSSWSETFYLDPFFPTDIVGSGNANTVVFSSGLRLAAVVPAPGTLPVAVTGYAALTLRRRRR